MPRQIRDDHTMRRHQIRDHTQPLGRVLSRPVQQDDRGSITALQHGSRHAVEFQPSLRDGQFRQQSFASALG